MSTKQKFIIDTDAGIDDAQAILMALATSDVDVVALTTVRGNAESKQVARNLLRLLKVADRMEVPVYRGCEDHLLGWEKPIGYNFHGKHGFGDVPDHDPPSENLVKPKHAVQAMLDITKQNQGDITLVAIGPLTNVAMAIRLDADFGKNLKNCFIMGGNYRATGNITTTGEFNFYSDPEAAYIALNHLKCPITLVCWELALDCFFPWETYEELRKSQSAKSRFMKDLEECTVTGGEKFEVCDELAMACAIDDDVIAKSSDVYATVELHGHMTRGQMVIDWRHKLGKKTNVRLVQDVNKDRLKAMLLRAVDAV